jgi:predicted Fe-Mo cluster-binding NifX family protein
MEKYPDSEASQAYNQIIDKIMEANKTDAAVTKSTPKKQEDKRHKREDAVMKIAIPIADGKLTAHFGHAAEFAIVHVEDQEITGKELLTPPPHEPGVLPRWLHELGVNVIIAGGMGQKALALFGDNGIKVVIGAGNLTPEELVKQYLPNTLVTGQNVCDH